MNLMNCYVALLSVHTLLTLHSLAFHSACLLECPTCEFFGGLQGGVRELTPSQRPLVVVLEEAEAVDTLTLQDLILVLSEVSNTGGAENVLVSETMYDDDAVVMPVLVLAYVEAGHRC